MFCVFYDKNIFIGVTDSYSKKRFLETILKIGLIFNKLVIIIEMAYPLHKLLQL